MRAVDGETIAMCGGWGVDDGFCGGEVGDGFEGGEGGWEGGVEGGEDEGVEFGEGGEGVWLLLLLGVLLGV